MNTLNKKLIAMSTLALTGISAHGATIFNLTADAASSTNSVAGGNIAFTVTDSFAYDPMDPTSPMAETNFAGSTGIDTDTANGATQREGWHAPNGGGNVSYLLSSFTTMDTENIIVVDLYGRYNSGDGIGAVQLRDNNLEVTLYNGGYAVADEVGSLTGVAIADNPLAHGRASFSLGNGVTFDRIRVESSADGWALMEIRAAAVPEPSSTALLGLGGLALIMRRRK